MKNQALFSSKDKSKKLNINEGRNQFVGRLFHQSVDPNKFPSP